jgi:single-strand DNA-binding protein
MNTVTVVGNLTRDPELRYTPTGQAVVKFSVPVNRFYTNRNGEKVEQTDFFTVNAWRSLAENVALSLKSGARVLITGRIQSRTWETEDGTKRTAVEIEAEEVAASPRWATAKLTKATKAGAQDWVPDVEPAEEAPAQ